MERHVVDGVAFVMMLVNCHACAARFCSQDYHCLRVVVLFYVACEVVVSRGERATQFDLFILYKNWTSGGYFPPKIELRETCVRRLVFGGSWNNQI